MNQARLSVLGILLLWLCSSYVGRVESSIHDYVNGSFSYESAAFIASGGSEGMNVYVRADKAKAGKYSSPSIRFESLTFRRPEAAAAKYTDMEPRSQLVEIVVFEVADRNKVASRNEDGVHLCCTQRLAASEGCNVGEVVVHDDSGWPKVFPVYFKGSQIKATISDVIEIPKTGMYNLYFIFCDSQLNGTVINGKTIWKNPTGYLPGRLAPLMKFYGFLSLAYLILGLIWLLQYIRFWKDILQLQNYITLVIALGMCEMVVWYYDYTNFNMTGYRPVGITLWAVTLGAVRKTVSRSLLLVVSMGYGVVRPTLGGLTSRVLLLGATYFVAAELFDVVENVGTINDLSGKEKLFLVLPVAILDAVFILWIFTSLSKTLEQLQARKNFVKLELYRKFTNSLAAVVVMSIAWIGYELFFNATDTFGERWQNAWIIPAFWNTMTFVLLCVICALWAPSKNAMRYAYSEEVQDDFDAEESIALTSFGVTPLPAIETERDKRFASTNVFSIEEDNGEDKTE